VGSAGMLIDSIGEAILMSLERKARHNSHKKQCFWLPEALEFYFINTSVRIVPAYATEKYDRMVS
jgi:hypothetical protein